MPYSKRVDIPISARCTIIVRQLTKGKVMVTLLSSDIVAITIALTLSVGLLISTAVANHRLTESRNYWRDQYHQLKNYVDQ